uniref:hypothetical protein n=1 Tax=Ferruginibacter sp. TaxID=1940288 RepID=UPI00374CD7C8
MNNKKSILIVLFFLSVLPAYKTVAQSNPYNEVSIASPTAASLGKYADIPVNYHTGIPQVSIPIYTVKEGPLSLPISISYHASGIKVLEVASWVGAGWSLNAGGVITRTVQGAPDERQTSNTYNQTHGHISDSGYNKYLWGPAFPTPVQLTMPTWAPIYERQEWEKFAEGKKDGEPDLFFFNFAGFSGKFYFHDDGSVVMVPEQDVKIEYSYTPGLGKSIESFTITTLDGTKYYFGKTNSTTDVDPVEITNPFNGDGGLSVGTAVSSWFLNKITSVDDFFSISLSYAAENYSYYTISTFPVLYNPTQSSTIGYKAVKNIVQGVRLSQIVFSNGKVDFTPSTAARFDLNGNTANFVDDANTEAKALSAIQVADNSGTDCRKFVFLYDYFTDNSSALPPYLLINSTTDKKRLKLISLQQQACDGSIIIPPHQFDYFTELVPRRLCFAQDHWGFINGATGNATLIPTYDASVFNTITGADRDAAWPAMRGGSLSRITYPTGGYSEFEFEQNYTWVNYSKPQSAFRFSPNAGYDGNSSAVTQYQPFTANSYRLTFTNSSQGSQALLNIYNSSNVNVKGYVLEAGRNYTEIFQLPAGTYRIVIQKLAAVSGNGTQATFEEWADVNIQKNETVGGLRIKKTTVYDGLSVANNIITNYTYEANGKSTGILYCRPAYFFPIRNNLLRDVGFENGPTCSLQGCIVCDPGVNYFQSPAGIRPMETTQGNHTGYNEVKVNQTGNGYSIYRYYGSNAWDLVTGDVAYRSMLTLPKTCDASIPNYPFTPFSHEFMRGELKYKANYNEAGQLLNDAWYYPVFQNNPRTTPALVIVPNPTTTGYLATFYTISTAKKTQTQVVENAIAPGIGYMQTSKYAYNESLYHTQVTKTTNESATGQVLETKIKYTTDFRITACDGISDCLQTYNTASATALTNFNSRKGSCGSPECRYWAWQAYMKDLSIARSNYVNCRKANYTGTTNAFNTCLINNKNAADTWLKPILDMQLKAVITPVETTNWRSGKLLSASFYKYDYAAIPATQVYLSKTLSISLPASSASFISADILSNSITKDSRYKDESVYKFLSGNPAEVTPKSGITLSYLW